MRVLFWSMFMLAVALFAAVSHSVISSARVQRALLPVSFAHEDHAGDNCVVCHHNFADHTGRGPLCIDCHKRSTQVAALIETQFHDLCRNCHMQRQAEGKEAGPVRACDRCHVADTRP